MPQLSKKQKQKLLSRLYWDMDVKTNDLLCVLNEETSEIGPVDKLNFYCRLLKTYDWYTLLKLIPIEKFKDVLSDPVLNRLYPREMKQRFLYARKILSK
jgi:hypothetical protein